MTLRRLLSGLYAIDKITFFPSDWSPPLKKRLKENLCYKFYYKWSTKKVKLFNFIFIYINVISLKNSILLLTCVLYIFPVQLLKNRTVLISLDYNVILLKVLRNALMINKSELLAQQMQTFTDSLQIVAAFPVTQRMLWLAELNYKREALYDVWIIIITSFTDFLHQSMTESLHGLVTVSLKKI